MVKPLKKQQRQYLWQILWVDKTNIHNQKIIGIKTLEKILELLRITKENVSYRNKTIELALLEKMLTALMLVIYNKTA